jgi:hypothetical protein
MIGLKVKIFVLKTQYTFSGPLVSRNKKVIEILDERTKQYMSFPIDEVTITSSEPLNHEEVE